MTRKLISATTFLTFLAVFIGLAFAGEDQTKHPSCAFCGMDRNHFSHSRMMVNYDNGSVGTCSLHCLAVEFALSIDKPIKSIQVGDYLSKQLIDAEKAFWTVGGEKTGVMTRRAKWAFEKKEDAEKIIAENGGTLATFDEAIKAAYEDMYSDTNMIREKRKKMKTMTK